MELVAEEGVDGDPTSTFRFRLRRASRRTTVMLRVIRAWLASNWGRAVVDLEAEKELYLRSLPRPASGGGPASVSSQSLWRNPIITRKKMKK